MHAYFQRTDSRICSFLSFRSIVATKPAHHLHAQVAVRTAIYFYMSFQVIFKNGQFIRIGSCQGTD